MDINKILRQQHDNEAEINRLMTNFKKNARKTPEYIKKKRSQLQTVWTSLTWLNSCLELGIDRSHVYITGGFFSRLEEKVKEFEALLDEAEQMLNPGALMGSQVTIPVNEEITEGETVDSITDLKKSTPNQNLKGMDTLTKKKIIKMENFRKLMEQVWDLLQRDDQASQMWNYYIDRINTQRSIIQDIFDEISLQKPDVSNLSNIELDKLDLEMSELISEVYRKQAIDTSPSNVEDKLRLAPINIPTFSGEYRSWCAFHDIFRQLVHENKKLSSVEKMQYLKTSLQGEAAKLIGHLDISNNSYAIAWELLDNRYNNLRMLCGAHIHRILHLPKVNQPTIAELKYVHDTIQESLHSISSLGVETDSWGPFIVHLILERLDRETVRFFEQSLTAPKEIPELNILLSFIQNRFQSLEMLHIQDQQTENKRSSFTKSYQANTLQCPLCKEGHNLYCCPKFLSRSIQERITVVKEKNLCYNCMTHSKSVECRSSRKCYKCGLNHHTLLHRDRTGSNETTSANVVKQLSKNQEVLLATAMVQVRRLDMQWEILRVLIDPGSQNSFITEEAAECLGLPRLQANVQVLGMGNTGAGTTKGKVKVAIKPRFSSKFNLGCELLVLKKLTTDLPAEETKVINRSELKNYLLADPTFDTTGPIDILLGADVYPFIIKDGIFKPKKGIIIQNTELGWVISGKENADNNLLVTRSMVSTIEEINDLTRFWEIEEVPSERKLTRDNVVCEELYRTTTTRNNCRYTVRLPLKNTSDQLGESRKVAMARLLQVEKRFKKDQLFKEEYQKFMREYEELGHMVRSPSNESNSYYIPHHAVMKEDSSTTKLRVVFDASAKTSSGNSLNDLMHTGPKLQEDLTHILLRWRKHKVVVSADIEKMYRQIRVNETDQPLQKILWRHNPTEPIKEFKLTTVTYGTTSAPYLAVRTLIQLAEDEENNYPRAAVIARQDFYVDDLMTGFDSIDEAKEVQQELIDMLQTGSFNLRKWKSNCLDLVNALPADLQEKHFLDMKETDTQKTLGLHWAPISDTFRFKTNLVTEKFHTKRSILSQVARIYDPLGWLTPVTIKTKLLLQNLWVNENKWDEPVPSDIEKEWLEILNTLPQVEEILIPRWIFTQSSCQRIELHGFCDASEKAYGAAVYTRVIDADGNIKVSLLTAKSKVAPLKMKKTLPRLELCGAVLASKLLKQSENALKMQATHSFAWTDSMIALAWIKGDPGRWENFVANRVGEILENTPANIWSHVKSSDNPADLISRGIAPELLKTMSLWWEGPEWLQCKKLPTQYSVIPHTEEGQKRKVMSFAAFKEKTDLNIIERFSSMQKLVRVVTYLQRFIAKCRKEDLPEYLTSTELKNSHDLLIKLSQNSIQQEMQRKSNCKLSSLSPFLDTKGLIRVGGRLELSTLSYEEKHPLLIPNNCHLAVLLIKEAHEKTLHGGVQLTLSTIRQNYWIIKGKPLVKRIIRQCITCFHASASPRHQLMGNLPASRVTMSHPFSHSGVDYAGPIQIRMSKGRGNKSYKGYIALFVCMSTKAIHLEAVSALTTEAFLAAFRRFQSRRGHCSHIYSDNGTNFVGASKIINNEVTKALKCPVLFQTLAEDGTTWHFTPPAAPHFGGLWEAGVKSTKYHLKRIIGDNTLTFEELSTVLCQIEACLNSRPLCGLSEENESILTPGHFLIGRPIIMTPDEMDLDNTLTVSNRWKLIKRMKQDFWKKWSTEYLHQLQQRVKWQNEEPNMEPGNIVLIKDEKTTATRWPLARIAEVHPGSDGKVRVVTVKTGQGSTLKRPISKICPLPIEDNRPKQKLPGMSAVNVVITMLCLVGFAKASHLSYTIKQPSSGLYIENLGEAMLNRGRLRVDIAMNLSKLLEHERLANQTIIHFEEACVSEMRVSGNSYCLNELQELQQRNEELKQQLQVLRNGYSNRKRRGLLGKLLTSVFGVNEEVYEDINKLNTNQEKIIRNSQHQSNLMIKTLVSLNSTEARITATVNKLTNGLNQGLNRLAIIDHEFTRIDAKTRVITVYQIASTLLRELDQIYGQLVRIVHHQGSLSDFLHPNDFNRIIRNITAYLPSNLKVWTTRPLDVELKTTSSSMVIQGYFCIIEKSKYEIMSITSLPKRVDGDLFTTQVIPNPILAVDADNELYFELHHEDLHNGLMMDSNQYLCSPDAVLDMNKIPNCALDVIYGRTQTSSCVQQTFHVPNQVWKHLYMINTWMFITNKPERISLRCNGELEGIWVKESGIIQLNQTCTLDTGKSLLKTRTLTQIQAIAAYHKAINISAAPVLNTSSIRKNGIPILKAHEDFGKLLLEEQILKDEEASTVWRTIHPHVTSTISGVVVSLLFIGGAYGVWHFTRRKVKNNVPLALVPLPRQNV